MLLITCLIFQIATCGSNAFQKQMKYAGRFMKKAKQSKKVQVSVDGENIGPDMEVPGAQSRLSKNFLGVAT